MAQHARDKCLVSSKVNVNDKCFRGGFWLTGGGGSSAPRGPGDVAGLLLLQ